jgi:type IV pilus assembly protein PilC
MHGIDIHKLSEGKQSSHPAPGNGGDLINLLNRDIQLFKPSLSDKKKERFYSELNILLAAGVDIQSALELIAGENSKEKDRLVFYKIRDGIVKGESLSDSVRNTKLFTPYEFHTLKIGEETGRLSDVLDQLGAYYVQKIKLKRQVVSALAYPALVLTVSFGAVFFMMRVVVPMFSDLFKRFKSKLPAITEWVIGISDGFGRYALPFLGIFFLVFAVLFSQRKHNWFRKASSAFILKIPLFGEITRKIYLARFCSSMSLLIGSKTSITSSLDLVSKMIGFYPIESSILVMKDDIVNRGLLLHVSMERFSIYGKRITSLVKVGEEVNKLDSMFARIAKQYSDEVEYQSSTIGSLIEPFLIIFLGIVVGVILVAMYLPLFQLSASFQ